MNNTQLHCIYVICALFIIGSYIMLMKFVQTSYFTLTQHVLCKVSALTKLFTISFCL